MTMATTTENAAMCPSVEVPVEPLMNKKGASAQYCTPKTIVRKSKPRLSKTLIRRAKVIAGYIVISLFICSIGGLIHMKIEQNALKDEILTTKGEVAQLKRLVLLMAENRHNHQNRPESPPMADEDDDNQDLDYGKDSPIDELSDGTGLSSGKDSFVDEPSNGVVPSAAGRVKRDSIMGEGKRHLLDLYVKNNHPDIHRNPDTDGETDPNNDHSRGKREANEESKTKKKKRDKKKKKNRGGGGRKNKTKQTEKTVTECPPQHKCRHSHECVNGIHLLPNFIWEDATYNNTPREVIYKGFHNVSTLFSDGNVPVVHGKYGHLEEGELFSPLKGTSAIDDGKYRYWRPDPSLHPHNKSSCMHYDTDSGRLTIKKPGFYYIYSQMTHKMKEPKALLQLMHNHEVKVNDVPFISCFMALSKHNVLGQRPTSSCHTAGARWLKDGDFLTIGDGYADTLPERYVNFRPEQTFWGVIEI